MASILHLTVTVEDDGANLDVGVSVQSPNYHSAGVKLGTTMGHISPKESLLIMKIYDQLLSDARVIRGISHESQTDGI